MIAVATIKGRGDFVLPPPKASAFSGYEWDVRRRRATGGARTTTPRTTPGPMLTGSCTSSSRQRDGRWTSAEVTLNRTLGYGTYAFVVRDTSNWIRPRRLGMLTYDHGSCATRIIVS